MLSSFAFSFNLRRYSQGEACMVLLERGATKRRQRSDGHISLTLAAAAGQASICAMLLQHGRAVQVDSIKTRAELARAYYMGLQRLKL